MSKKETILMNVSISKASNIRLKILGWYQIIGGVIGILLTIWLLAHIANISGLMLLLFLVAFGLYGSSIYCGKLLLGSAYHKGLTLSIINQALQTVSFLMLGYGFMYVSGIMLIGGINYDVGGLDNGFKMGFNFGLTSKWNIDFASGNRSFALGINFIALYLAYFCYQLQQRIRKEEANAAMVSVGD